MPIPFTKPQHACMQLVKPTKLTLSAIFRHIIIQAANSCQYSALQKWFGRLRSPTKNDYSVDKIFSWMFDSLNSSTFTSTKLIQIFTLLFTLSCSDWRLQKEKDVRQKSRIGINKEFISRILKTTEWDLRGWLPVKLCTGLSCTVHSVEW